MKKILFLYPSMMLGGSTTALLSLMNGMDPSLYQIDLQLQSNSGPLFSDIPAHVRVLPPAQKYVGRAGRVIKMLRFVFQGVALRAWIKQRRNGKRGFSPDVINEFFARSLSKKNREQYDYALGFLEGWSNWYLAYRVKADKKYAWMHSTFANITDDPDAQLPWMKKVDKIVFVTDACTDAFKQTMPCMAEKAITVENITDSEIIRKRGLCADENDVAYMQYKEANCFKIITVCRITIETKGLDRVVNCAKSLKAQGLKFLWYIIGSGPDEGAFRALISDAGVEECVIAIGVRYNPYPFIKEADVMCMPSRYEGKPMVITESMILGTPVVVTEYLSANAQVCNGVDGIVVENSDTSIVHALQDCIQDGQDIARMRERLARSEYGNRSYIQKIQLRLFE